MLHKFYVFTVVDYFGIYIPQVVLTIASIGFFVYLKDKIIAMDDIDIKEWHVSGEVLGIVPEAKVSDQDVDENKNKEKSEATL